MISGSVCAFDSTAPVSGQQPSVRKRHHPFFNHFARLQVDTVVINHHQHTVAFQNRTFRSEIQRHNVDIFQPDVLPDILLGPVREREDADAFAFVNLPVVVVPQLWALIFRIPAMEAVTERVDSLFSAGFLFVTARTTEGGIKTVFVQRLFQPSVFIISVCFALPCTNGLIPIATPSGFLCTSSSQP
ncbi:Uncharacterised protein [Escherichia coli]|nr:Uncharacterised protein [Escherichia coli]